MDFLPNLQSALGLIAFPLIALAFCKGAKRFNLKLWAVALGVQFVLALLFLKVPFFKGVFAAMNKAVLALQEATTAGTSFVFGYLGGGSLPFEELQPGSSYILAFQAFPLIIVLGALTALLSHWRVLPFIIEGLAKIFSKTLNIGCLLYTSPSPRDS